MMFGAITSEDAQLLESIILESSSKGSLKFLEIGVHEGNTARGVMELCREKGIELTYWGVDACYETPPFPGASHVFGKSEEVFEQVPDKFDVVFVDGCHCLNHVLLDAIHYFPKVRIGGFILFHDTSPQVQGVQKNHWVHGREDCLIYRTAVVAALFKLDWSDDRWQLKGVSCDPNSDIGGIMAFRKC